jgi:hypothetical protein
VEGEVVVLTTAVTAPSMEPSRGIMPCAPVGILDDDERCRGGQAAWAGWGPGRCRQQTQQTQSGLQSSAEVQTLTAECQRLVKPG